ncbi:MAG TPA: CotS family spore coat protein, partial [Ignavibacteriales bacterium]|nr:CotS family spore coat protein [Ignavibacteriales bacterium]
EGDQGLFCLKKVHYKVDQLLFIYSAMEHLINNGFNRIGRILLNDDNLPYVTDQNDVYYVAEWVTGKECSYKSKAELKAATIAMAEVHKASKGFVPVEGSCIREEWGKWPGNFRGRLKQMLEFKDNLINKTELTEFDRVYLIGVDYFYQEGLRALDILAHSEYMDLVKEAKESLCFCHHDMAYHNVIMKDKMAYLIDFDYCIYDLRIHDLGSLILRNIKRANWDIRKAEFILNVYNSVNPLQKRELKVLSGFMRFPQDYWQAAYTYYAENIGRPEKVLRKKLERNIRGRYSREQFFWNLSRLI